MVLAPQSVAYLGQQLRPVSAPDAAKIAAWVRDLDADDFATRREAARELERLGDLAEPALRKVLEGMPSPELRRQVTRLLERLAGFSPEDLRRVRAVEALELTGTPEARKVLQALAKGAPEARLTREAMASLERLNLRLK